MRTYFAADGSYGSAEKMIVVNTSSFTAEDWENIECATDSDLIQVVYDILDSKESRPIPTIFGDIR